MPLRVKCLSCESSRLEKIVDLGMHSFADRFIAKTDIASLEPTYQLSCSLCKDCGFIQNDVITSPEERYQDIEYSYTSSNSNFSIQHWKKYAYDMRKECENKSPKILEIGSNDGTLLKFFKDTFEGVEPIGIDASPKMVDISKSNGINTFCGIFGDASVKLDFLKDKTFDLIIANNVLNHSEDPRSFILSASKFLRDKKSFIVYELPYWKFLVDESRYDQIYHEHISYFTIENSINFVNRLGLDIFRIEINDYHGGSIRVFIGRKNCHAIDYSVINLLEKEKGSSLRSFDTYQCLMSRIRKNKQYIMKKVLEVSEQNRPIICIGAAAKANTFLTYTGLNNTLVKFITDTSEFKIKKLTPLTRIPILSDHSIAGLDAPLCIITSWNISSRLKDIILNYNPNAEILLPHSGL